MNSKPTANPQEPVALTRAFDLAREMTRRTRKLPRDLRPVLGDRMLTTTYDILDAMITARYSRNKKGVLEQANLLLARLRFQIRLCVEEKLLSLRQYEYLAGMVEEVGRMAGGWRKSLAEKFQDNGREDLK